MKTKNKAELALIILSEGIIENNKRLILEAYDIVESDVFDWEDYSYSLFEQFNKKADIANDLLYS